VIPFQVGDGSTIPGRGFCAFLLVYWTHMNLKDLSPHTISARLDLTIVANRKRLAVFLNECHFYLGSPVILEPEVHDDFVLTKLQYTANRLLTLS
jgi:lipoprotein NlpI